MERRTLEDQGLEVSTVGPGCTGMSDFYGAPDILSVARTRCTRFYPDENAAVTVDLTQEELSRLDDIAPQDAAPATDTPT